MSESFYCVTLDNGRDGDKVQSHGPYNTREAADAFDEAVEWVADSSIEVLGVYEAENENAAIAAARQQYGDEIEDDR